jgi:hypothetical protein
MMSGSAPIVGALKDATICGSKVMCVASATGSQIKSLAGDVVLSKTCTSNTMRTAIAQVIGVIPATRVTGIHTGETGISIHPMQVRD